MNVRTFACRILLPISLFATNVSGGDETALRKRAAESMARATTFFRTKVATNGGYLWKYSLDFTRREGEGRATATQIWVQPPGTPAVGMAFLHAYHATGDHSYLEAATQVAKALVWGQLASGGWDYKIDFDEKEHEKWYTRRDVEEGKKKRGKYRNVTTFDDNVSQSATRLLMRVDKALGFQDRAIHQAVEYALSKFIEAQYPNGAWPQRYASPPDPAKFPVRKARYPEHWARAYPKASYAGHYTFNDNAIADVIATFLEAYQIYKKEAYLVTAKKGGDFILLAQMPNPQPVWAQQYDTNMEPAWARKFEPPSVVSAESVGVIAALLDLYQATGEKKYVETLPRAFAWFERSALADGRLARFYELKTNKPLYFTKKYELTYRNDDLPTHYGFLGNYNVTPHVSRYEKLMKTDRAAFLSEIEAGQRAEYASVAYEKRARNVIDQLDDQGRWTRGAEIHVRDFNRNLTILANYMAAAASR